MFKSPQNFSITFKRKFKLIQMECRSHTYSVSLFNFIFPISPLHALLQPSNCGRPSVLSASVYLYLLLSHARKISPPCSTSLINFNPPSLLNQYVFSSQYFSHANPSLEQAPSQHIPKYLSVFLSHGIHPSEFIIFSIIKV